MINNFITLIEILNEKRKENITENDVTEETKIYELIDKKKDSFTNDNFIKMFQSNDSLTIDKTYEIFEYYLKLIYEDIKNEIKRYQKNLDIESIQKIKNLNSKENIIDKKDFAHAIRLFITLVLFLENDKEKKIKSNLNNVINYLKSSDLWDKNIYDNKDFNINLNKLKLINAHINQIIYLYENLGKDIEDNFFDDVKRQIEKEKEKEKTVAQKLSEKEEGVEGDGNKLNMKSGKVEKIEDEIVIEEKPIKKEESEDEEESEEEGGGRWAKKENDDEDDDDE
jgi:hypothetical protein